MSVIDKVLHYQRSIEKCWDDEDRMMHCISKLYVLPITVQHLRDTGVGRTVNSLRKYDGGVGDAAKALVAKWKTMVANEDSSDPEDEDEACVPDAPESYSDGTPESTKRDENSENDLSRHSSQESKDRHKSKFSKSGSSNHGSKHSSKIHSSSENTNSQNKEKHNVHKEKYSKSTSKDCDQRYESKSRKHTSKHDSDSDIKSRSLRDSPQDSKRGHDSKGKTTVDTNSSKVSSSTESVTVNNHRKRKHESSVDKECNKKYKCSSSESDEGNSRLLINSPTNSESESPKVTTESVTPTESETVTKKSSQLYDQTSSRKEGNSKDRKREKEKNDSKHKSKTEAEKEYHKAKDSIKDDKRKKESHSSSKHCSKSKSSHSSHSSKDSAKHSNKEDKDRKSKKEEKSRTSSENKEKDQKLKKKIKKEMDEDDVGIDSQSGTSFADALGMCMLPPPSRKRGGNVSSSSTGKTIKEEPTTFTIKTEDDDLEPNPTFLLAPNVKLEPLSIDLAATLPEISPNYKPMPRNLNPVNRKFKEDSTLSEIIYAKNQRTKVFSGNKTSKISTVPTLYDICIRILIENIDALEVTGGVPYYIIKPVLERATPAQLMMLETHNPYLIEDTNELWEFHCGREFRTKKREEMESWREMYERCYNEREEKLEKLAGNIKQSNVKLEMSKRKSIAFDNIIHVKPPRSVLRQQAKYGTARDLSLTTQKKISITSKEKPSSTNSCSTNICPPVPIPRIKSTTSSIGKKTKAPLMAKALQLIKSRYRR